MDNENPNIYPAEPKFINPTLTLICLIFNPTPPDTAAKKSDAKSPLRNSFLLSFIPIRKMRLSVKKYSIPTANALAYILLI